MFGCVSMCVCSDGRLFGARSLLTDVAVAVVSHAIEMARVKRARVSYVAAPSMAVCSLAASDSGFCLDAHGLAWLRLLTRCVLCVFRFCTGRVWLWTSPAVKFRRRCGRCSPRRSPKSERGTHASES